MLCCRFDVCRFFYSLYTIQEVVLFRLRLRVLTRYVALRCKLWIAGNWRALDHFQFLGEDIATCSVVSGNCVTSN